MDEARPTFSTDSTLALLERESGNPANDTVEAFMYSIDTGVVMSGQMLDEKPALGGITFNRCGLWFKPFFYRHVESILKAGEEVTEILPTCDFFHRYT